MEWDNARLNPPVSHARDPKYPLIIGISGSSSSGKTVLTSILYNIFPNIITMHQDSFKKKVDCPTVNIKEIGEDGIKRYVEVENADCYESVDWKQLKAVLKEICEKHKKNKLNGGQDGESKADRKTTSQKIHQTERDKNLGLDRLCDLDFVNQKNMKTWKNNVETKLEAINGTHTPIVIIEGHLLPYELESLEDMGLVMLLWLSTSRDVARQRRFERWVYKDAPEGGRYPNQKWKTEAYFDQVVWKEAESVERALQERVKKENKEGLGIVRVREHNEEVKKTVDWAVYRILEQCEWEMNERYNIWAMV